MADTAVLWMSLVLAVVCVFLPVFSRAEFIVTHAPEHVQFFNNAGNLKLSEVEHVISSAFGYDVKRDISWEGLSPGNLFQRPKANVVFSVEGLSDTDLALDHVAKFNTDVDEPVLQTEEVVNKITSASDHKPLLVDFSVDSAVFEIRSHQPDLFRDVPATYSQLERAFTSGEMTFSASELGSLNASRRTDLLFLGELHLVKEIVDVLKANPQMLRLASPDFFHFKIRGAQGLRQEYGVQSEQLDDAVKLIQSFLKQMTQEFRDLYRGNVIVEVVTIPVNADVLSRKVRSLLQSDEATTAKPSPTPSPSSGYNLAGEYDEMFPVIFNIVLWLGLALTISIIAISYGMWHMDPGRDSIIYRMTSQRIKKD